MTKIIKSLLTALLITIAAVSCNVSKQTASSNNATLTINYSFANIVDGYDHLTYSLVDVDGVVAAKSEPHLESNPATVIIPLSKGIHTIKLVNYAQYDGAWEEHIIKNEYSIDCVFEKVINVDKDLIINLLFDIDEGTLEK